LFCEGLAQEIGAELRVHVQLFEASIFVLQLLHPRHQRRIHATELRPPLVERRVTDAVRAAELRHGRPTLRFLQDGDDLAVGKP